MLPLQKEEVREEGAGAVAREGYATEVSVSQSGSEAVELAHFEPVESRLLTSPLDGGQSITSANPAQHHHQHHHQHQHTLQHQPPRSKSKR